MSPSVRSVARARCAMLLALTLMSLAQSAFGRGTPPIERYDLRELDGLPPFIALAVGAEPASVFVGTAYGYSQFRSGTWRAYRLPLRNPARALHRAADGRVYVGSKDEFGVIETTDAGEGRYEDLRPRFGLSERRSRVGEVWAVFENSRGVYFRAERELFLLQRDGTTLSWPLDESVRQFSVANDELIVRVQGKGVCRFRDGELELLPGGEVFADMSLILAAASDDRLLLVGGDGFYEA
ncbi:MAG TPA: hypothetical protein VFO79_01245, partial [Xanthomonadales bacterium]|nr:hypothetical protein [Xanthomonadales bacterium]